MTSLVSHSASEREFPPLSVEEERLLERLTEEMTQRWRSGERPLVEEYFRKHPQLCTQPGAALELVYEEIYLRQENGQEVRVEDLIARFPQWSRQLEALLKCHHLLAPQLAGPFFPKLGETLGEFRLLAELGRGTQSRVFLATQSPLADRLVVLKLGPSSGREHLSLARLQHTHLVPLYSAHEYPTRRLCALCMPYFGGATLDRLLKKMQSRPPGQRTGQHILDALHDNESVERTIDRDENPCSRFLARVSYIQAVCWIGACLADALHYAHERGLLHLDLKPSNVLLAADGQPMLLDFHLARAPIFAGGLPPLWLGGTPGYMAPEHQAAMDAVVRQEPVAIAVDVGADIYSLGVLLHELLSGETPKSIKTQGRSLRRFNPRVTVGLTDVVGRCLNPISANRYQTAAALANDLRRHLADLPLQGVVNRSLTERWAKWRRRRRHAAPLLGLLFAVFVALVLALLHFANQAHKAQTALDEGREYLRQQRYSEALQASKHGVALIEDSPFHAATKHQLQDTLRQAERGQAIQELHTLCEHLRPLYSATTLPEAQARVAEAQCHLIWQQRNTILQRLGAHVPFESERQVRADLLDLAILGTHLRVHLASQNGVELARKQALNVLMEAEALFGPSFILSLERQAHMRSLGLNEAAVSAERQVADLVPQTAWEHCAVGLAYFRAGDYRRAAEAMDRALELEPNSLWANYYRGSCAYRLKKFEEAVKSFSICVALSPQSAWCYANRGMAYDALGQSDRTRHDYDRAFRLDPALDPSLPCRSFLSSWQERWIDFLRCLRR
jgi:serine/threonine protein kinase